MKMRKKQRKTQRRRESKYPATIVIQGDGGVKVSCGNIHEAEEIATRLAQRMHKRLVTDRMFG